MTMLQQLLKKLFYTTKEFILKKGLGSQAEYRNQEMDITTVDKKHQKRNRKKNECLLEFFWQLYDILTVTATAK